MPIYKVSMEEARWGAVFPGKFVPVLTFEGKYSGLRAKTGLAHFRWKTSTNHSRQRGKAHKKPTPSHILACKHCRSTESEQDPQKLLTFRVIYLYWLLGTSVQEIGLLCTVEHAFLPHYLR
jgi:hypothetical protein